MEKSENCYANANAHKHRAGRCKVCGKEGISSAIKDQIEANHLEGIVIPCNLCDKTLCVKSTQFFGSFLNLHTKSTVVRWEDC